MKSLYIFLCQLIVCLADLKVKNSLKQFRTEVFSEALSVIIKNVYFKSHERFEIKIIDEKNENFAKEVLSKALKKIDNISEPIEINVFDASLTNFGNVKKSVILKY